ncbi:MAG: cell division protein ZapD [Coxiellaceae bacterium]|jgi:cell division protein ZapD|nr:cell division protein ZapD [Coxiellaceae bacterium]
MIYEQPLNEQIRLCLRLEYLFDQANYYLTKESFWDLHQILRVILEILQATDRPDIKNKFCQTLNQYIYTLSQLEKLPDVDQEKLSGTIRQIDRIIDVLHANQKKIGQELRDDEFLNGLQQRFYTPAGTCGFNLPNYQLWLQQKAIAHRQLLTWFKHLDELQDTVNIILKILRESSSFRKMEAREGFHQSNLDLNFLCQMIRIKIPEDKNFFPEVSIGRHRIAIHFFTLDINGKTNQISYDVAFELACCRV